MRYVALDLGDRRTGLAVGDSETRVVTPLTVIEIGILVAGGDALLGAIAREVEAQMGPARQATSSGKRLNSPGELVVGLPWNMDGTLGPRAKIVQAFARRVEQRTGRKVNFQDERLTTADADWSMAKSGMTHQQKKERRDALAAAAILKDFLGQGASAEPPAHTP